MDAAPNGLYCVSVTAPVEANGKPIVVACSNIASATLDVQSLTNLAKSVHVADSHWIVPLDRKMYNIFVIELPPVRADEMEQSVRWAVSTMLSYPVAEAAVAWMNIPTEKLLPNRAPHMYVIAAREEFVAEFRETFKKAKVPIRAIDVQETAHRNIAALAAKPGEGVVLLSIGLRGVQLTVTFEGELYLDRYVDEALFGSAVDEAAKERARERVVLQVQRSLDFISRTLPFIDVGRVLLAPMPAETGLRELIAQNLTVPVESLDLGTVFDFSRTPELMREENQSNYFVALGTALRVVNRTA